MLALRVKGLIGLHEPIVRLVSKPKCQCSSAPVVSVRLVITIARVYVFVRPSRELSRQSEYRECTRNYGTVNSSALLAQSHTLYASRYIQLGAGPTAGWIAKSRLCSPHTKPCFVLACPV